MALIKTKTDRSVAEAIDALQTAVEGAGAKVFARVNHAGGAASIDMKLEDCEVLIFGNPKVGTPAIQADPAAGLYLPLKVLAYKDADGTVWITYQDPASMFDGLNIDKDAEFIKTMQGALAKLTAAAAG